MLLSAGFTVAKTSDTPSGVSISQEDAVSVVITSAGPNKVKVVKVLRTHLDIDLREAKEMVDKVDNGPVTIASKVAKDKAEQMKKELEEAGAKVELK